jgi:hypothetical protein
MKIIFLRGYKTWSLALAEERKLRVSERKVLRIIQLKGRYVARDSRQLKH